MRNKTFMFLLLLLSISFQQAQARYYEPVTGRFLQEDPEWNTNLYIYASDNPLTFIDPSGKAIFYAGNKEGRDKWNALVDKYLGWMPFGLEGFFKKATDPEGIYLEMSLGIAMMGTPLNFGDKGLSKFFTKEFFSGSRVIPARTPAHILVRKAIAKELGVHWKDVIKKSGPAIEIEGKLAEIHWFEIKGTGQRIGEKIVWLE